MSHELQPDGQGDSLSRLEDKERELLVRQQLLGDKIFEEIPLIEESDIPDELKRKLNAHIDHLVEWAEITSDLYWRESLKDIGNTVDKTVKAWDKVDNFRANQRDAIQRWEDQT